MNGLPVTAASLILSIYCDIVVPRGGVLWMGSLIDICDKLGIRENLVRTAASRLVSAGRLQGQRVGRRSFYQLAPSLEEEFSETDQLLYAPYADPTAWTLTFAPDLTEREARRYRMARIGGDVWLCPERPNMHQIDGVMFRAEVVTSGESLARLAMLWDLETLASQYEGMLTRFDGLDGRIRDGCDLEPEDALIARLLLAHVYRELLARDPGLPVAALPPEWMGCRARRFFHTLYAALSPVADAHVACMLQGRDGPLAAQTDQIRARMVALQ